MMSNDEEVIEAFAILLMRPTQIKIDALETAMQAAYNLGVNDGIRI